jgi:glycosyltransferase involved in cell wall biosynthesis
MPHAVVSEIGANSPGPASAASAPALSVVIPTFNNLPVLKQCLESWRHFAGDFPVELLVVEDGCKDDTPAYLEDFARTDWGRRHLRWFHEADMHELRCTNRGMAEATAELVLVWQDDMFVQTDWLAAELVRAFKADDGLGLLALSRGLDCFPLDEPVRAWEDLHDPRRLRSTIGPSPLNWFRLAEVDIVIRPWVVRRTCLAKVGRLDEAFVPTEWDEADLCFRIRRAGWKVAVHGYERLGAYRHLGSTTLGHTFTDKYKQRVLQNGQLFHARWDETIRREHQRPRTSWVRRATWAGWAHTFGEMARYGARRLRRASGRGRQP